MADRTPAPDTPELRARWGSFEWTRAKCLSGDALILGALQVLLRDSDR